jgi:subtilisin family serine protease
MQNPGSDPVNVIVTTRRGRQQLVEKLQTRGDSVYSDHPSIGVFAASVDAGDLTWLANDPDVDSLSLDAVVTPTGGADASPPDSTFVETLGLDDVPFTGKDIGIAVIDSGLEHNPDFDNSEGDSYDFTANGRKVKPYDDYGHGTHISGLIAGSGLSGWVAAQRSTIVNSDPALDLGSVVMQLDPPPRSCLSTALCVGEQLVGALTVYSAAAEAFANPHVDLIQLLAPRIAEAVQEANSSHVENPQRETLPREFRSQRPAIELVSQARRR